ncbi:MAG: hypothetical protein ABL921_33315, partial [Pirellula sp.]
AAAFFWIRARWVRVAVIDENGIIASTIEQKYDLDWCDLVGARTSVKYAKDTNVPKVNLLLLLEDERGLEMPIQYEQQNALYQILADVKFKHDSPGQRLGTLKGTLLFVFGTAAFLLGLWWVFVLKGQMNNGVLLQGNGKGIIIKLALGVIGPVGGLGSACWGLYHIVVRPILYQPGWQETQSW